MKKIIAMLVAIVMCASVMAVVGSADFKPGITSQLPSGATGEFAWLGGYTSTYCHKTASGTDLTTFQGNREETGVSVRAATFIDMHEWNTLCIYWLGDSYGTAGRKFNGFAINDCGDKNQSDSHSTVMTAEKVLKTFEIYTTKTVGTWNSWEKIGINDVEYKWDSDSNAGYWLMWFDREVTTDALLVHFEPGSDAVAADMSKVATHGNYLGGLYDSNGVHSAPAAGGDDPAPVTPTPVVENTHPDFVGMAMQQPSGERTTYPGPYDQSAIQSVHYNLYANFNNGVTAGGISFTENNTSTATNGSWFADAKIYVTNEKWSEAQGSAWSLDGMTEVPAKHSVDGLVHTYKFGKAVNAKTILIVWGGEADGGHLQFSTSNVTILEPSADTSDMLSISIAVASVAILGTAAAIVMKKRKED